MKITHLPPARITGWMMTIAGILAIFMLTGVSVSADAPAGTLLEQAALINGVYTPPPVVINEFNFNSPDDWNTDDWVELFNNGPDPVDISEFIFTDNEEGHFFIIPDGMTMAPWSYLVLCRNWIFFRILNPEMEAAIGNFPFGLSGGGESIMLYNAAGALVDSVAYDDKLPWPPEADGLGSTLELITPALDNNTLYSWVASTQLHGTPGERNSVFITSVTAAQPEVFSAGPAYPNPFNPVTVIPFSLNAPGHVRIEIFSILGQRVAVLTDSSFSAGTHSVVFDGRSLAAGIYIYRAQTGKTTLTGSVLLVK